MKIILIRHAEKPKKGDNLTCQGFNRSVKLPAIIRERYGVPGYIYVPSIGRGESTKHSRMFQTVLPLAIKYNLAINSQFKVDDSMGLAADILKKKGTVLVVWQHTAIPRIVNALGIRGTPKWPEDDYDSIWTIDFSGSKPKMKIEKENLTASESCAF
ncbi:MAG: histidine phosphatase family protein [Bacteroidetes bacterium]|nr:MAG: histidine phosphatase family protein [Bacteroidota bacterium]